MDSNLLVIAYYFPPMGLSGVQRTMKFVKYLPEFGWNVNVLSAQPDSYYAYDETLLEELDREEIILHTASRKKNHKVKLDKKAKKFPNWFTQKLGRAVLQTLYQPDSKIRWKKAAIKAGERIMKEHDINAIFSTAPPFTDFLVARELAKKFDKPFIVDYRDTWVDNPFHFYATPFHKSKSIKMENDILTHASKIIVTTRYSKELLLKRYRILRHEDIMIIPHGFDPDDFNGSINGRNEKFVITHSGLFQDNRTPKPFLKALASFVKKHPEAKNKIEAKFVGLMRKNHLKLVNKLGLDDIVKCTGYLNHREAVAELQTSDVLWLMLDDTIRSPGKLYEYFGAKKPILVSTPDGVIRNAALETEAAIATDPKNEKQIEKAIAEFYEMWESNHLPKVNEEYVNQFNRKILTGVLSRELSLVADI